MILFYNYEIICQDKILSTVFYLYHSQLDFSLLLCIIKIKGGGEMENGGPYRASSNPKPEKLIIFFNHYDAHRTESCVEGATRWLANHSILVEILLRVVGVDQHGNPSSIVIWYREL
jgi:hypothetical protein